MNSNGRSGVKKFNGKVRNTDTYIYNSNNYYYCGYWGYGIYQINTNRSGIHSGIADCFEGIEKNTLTGNSGIFTTKRVIIIEMK